MQRKTLNLPSPQQQAYEICDKWIRQHHQALRTSTPRNHADRLATLDLRDLWYEAQALHRRSPT